MNKKIEKSVTEMCNYTTKINRRTIRHGGIFSFMILL